MTLKLLKDKRVILGAGLVLLSTLLVIFLGRTPENTARPEQEFNIPAFGNLPDLKFAMKQDSEINMLVQRLLGYDEAFIFVNYSDVNNDMARLMFLWVGIDNIELKRIGAQRAIAVFLRRVYGLPDDEPIMGNPLLEGNPWGDLFNRYKAQILMQGHGYKIYDGLAYYDNEEDQMVVRANLSKNFVEGFAEFLKTQEVQARKKYLNNFLLFIRETKGLKNLSEQDKKLIKKLRG